jgi:colanic acid/amylovoran biosynthesis glycosyltransferase
MSITNNRAVTEPGRRRPTPLVARGAATSVDTNAGLWPKAVPELSVTSPPAGPIGYVLGRFPGPSQAFVRDEICELGRCGVEVHVFVVEPARDAVDERGLAGAASTSRFPSSAFLGDLRTVDAERRTRHMQAAWIAREVVTRRIEHLHATELAMAGVAREVRRSTGVRYSFAVTGSDIYHDGRDPRTLRDQMPEAEFVIVPSEVSRQQLLAVTGAGANRNVHRIYRGVDLERFRFGADPFRESNSVLAVCPLSDESGVADLIQAVAVLRDRRSEGIRATIVGEGELEQDVRAQIASLGLDDCVTLLGRYEDGSDLLPLMRSHAVMALPYTALPGGGRDGVPPVLLEAMAVGLPVVSTGVVGVSEVLEDGWTGRLVSPHDPKWLAGAVETLLDNVRLRVRMAKDARAQVECYFGLSRNVSRLARLFATTAAERNIAR